MFSPLQTGVSHAPQTVQKPQVAAPLQVQVRPPVAAAPPAPPRPVVDRSVPAATPGFDTRA